MFVRSDTLDRLAKIYSPETVAQVTPFLGTAISSEEFVADHIKTCHAKGKPSNKHRCAKKLYRYLKKWQDIL